jgi:hypothetical protein
MVHALQAHALPENDVVLGKCAVRAGYGEQDRIAASKRFAAGHARPTKVIHGQATSFFSRAEGFPIFEAILRSVRGQQ